MGVGSCSPERRAHLATIMKLLAIALALLAGCEPPTPEVQERARVVVLAQTPQAYEEAQYRATWALPAIELDALDVVVESIAPDVVWTCRVWAPPVLGPRLRGVEFTFTAGPNVGEEERLRIPAVEITGVKNRRDRLLSCESTAPSAFHGLIARYRETVPVL